MAELMTLLAGVVAGLVLGLTGAGGSVLAIPLLVYGLGWAFTSAVPVALLAVSVAAGIGAAMAWPGGLVRWRAALLLAAFGALTTPLGMTFAHALSIHWLLLAFAVVALLVALRMWRQAQATPADAQIVRAGVGGGNGVRDIACGVDPDTGRLQWTPRCFGTIAVTGAATGFLGGAFGVGGGFVIVPALRARTGLGMHSAVATSLLAIALTSASGALFAFVSGQFPTADMTLPFVAGALAGMVAGRYAAPHVAGPALQKVFAATMFAVALWMTFDVLH